MHRLCLLLCLLLLGPAPAPAQDAASLSAFLGLRAASHAGAFKAAAFLPEGAPVLLYDEGDGLHLLKADASLSHLLADTHLGARGDTGLALTADSQGFLYVGGTSTSGQLAGTSGAAFPAPADTSFNSFVARFDSNLQLLSLTFLGAGHTVLSGIAVTPDALFVTGLTYSPSFPTTASAVQSQPAAGSTGNGFVERFTLDGTQLRYATFLSAPNGSVTPSAITADTAGHAYLTGSTSSAAFPVTAALQPVPRGAISGFLTALTPAGDAFVFSTYLPGSGLSSIAWNAGGNGLLLTGNLDPALFPIAQAFAPLAATPYQSLLRLSADGQTVQDSTFLFPGSSSQLTPDPHGGVWITGPLALPLSPAEQHAGPGDSYTAHLSATDTLDRLLRLGGSTTDNPAYASLTSSLGAPALSPLDGAALVPATVSLTTDPSLLSSQTFDLDLSASPGDFFPAAEPDFLPSACTPNQSCGAAAGMVALLQPTIPQPVLTLSAGDLPNLTIRNRGTLAATGVTLSSTSASTSNCPQTLLPGQQCGAIVLGTSGGNFTLSAGNAATQTFSIPAQPSSSTPSLLLSSAALDFGIVPSVSPASRTITISNLSTLAQTFASQPANPLASTPYTLAETSSTCAGAPTAHTLPAGATCTITVTLAASPDQAHDGPVKTAWQFGPRSLPVTGFAQAAALTVSSTHLDFGPQAQPAAARLPRFLFLSNASSVPVQHAPASLSSGAAFQLTDECPSLLQPASVCRLKLTYTAPLGPSADSATLTLDDGLSVLLTGQTITAVPNPTAPPSPFAADTSAVQFTTSIPVTTLSAEAHTVQVSNPSAITEPLSLNVLGDFPFTTNCDNNLPPASSCSITLHFAPSQPGTRVGVLVLSAGSASQDLRIPLSGTGQTLLTLPSDPLDLGTSTVGEPVTRWLQLKNTLPTLTLTSSSPQFTVALLPDTGSTPGLQSPASFSTSATSPCSNCWIGVQFLPGTAGLLQGTLQLSTGVGGQPYSIGLTGTALPAQGLVASPAQLTFGAIPVNSSAAPQLISLLNALPDNATASFTALSATGDFTVVPSANSCSITLPATASCAIAVTFTPTATGTRTGSLLIATDHGPLTLPLAGIGTRDPGLSLSPTSLTFTTTAPQTLTLRNTGSVTLTLGDPSSSTAAFSPGSSCQALAPGASCTVTVSYTGQNVDNTAVLTLPVTAADITGQTTTTQVTVPLDALLTTGGGLSLFPAQADFGVAPTGSLGQLRQFTLTNTTAATIHPSFAASRNFPLATTPACASLAPGASCNLSLLFVPQQAGSLTGTLQVTATTPDGTLEATTLAYTQGFASSAATLTASAATDPDHPLNFGQIASAQSATSSLTLANPGSLPVHIRRLSTTAPFQVDSTCDTLAPAATCTLNITYAPTYQLPATALLQPRADRGTLIVETDAATSPTTLYLSGSVQPASASATGTQPLTASLPILTLALSALTFPDTAPGATSLPLSLNLANTGSVPVQLGGLLLPPEFTVTSTCAPTLPPGASCALAVTFQPSASAPEGPRAAVLGLRSSASTALDFITLFGDAITSSLDASPTALTFSGTAVGSSSSQTLTVTNVTTLPLSLASADLTGDFVLTASTCGALPLTLGAGQSCTFTFTFTPTTAGPRTGQLTLAPAGSLQPLAVPLTGTGLAGHLAAGTHSLSFNAVTLGASATETLTLTNSGNVPLTAPQFALAGPDAAAFTYTSACGTAPLATGSTCSAAITFTPAHTGPATATLTVASSDPLSPLAVTLSGSGAQSPGFSLTVNGTDHAAMTVPAGSLASFALQVTPAGGYSQLVALTCTPVNAAPNTSCSLSQTTMPLAPGPGSLSASLTTASGILPASPPIWWLVPVLLASRRTRRRVSRARHLVWFATAAIASTCLLGCGGASGITGAPYTPAGTYVYQVTARSTTGAALSSTVTLTLIVP